MYKYDYGYNSGEEDAYESERQAYEREAQAEAEAQAERERERQAIVAARIQEAFEAEVSAAWGVYYNRVQKFNEKGVQRQQTLATALLSKTDSTLALFAMDRPKVVRGNLKHVKEYLVAPPTKIFQAAHLHIGHVVLDEVVLSKQALPLHFDVEIKKVTLTLSITMLCDVLKAHLDAEYRDYEPSIIGELVDAFCEVAVQDWEEEKCASGLEMIKGAITKVLREVVPQGEGEEDAVEEFLVLTGCRRDKFSLHVKLKRIFCDSQLLTMPLVVFEIARVFTWDNTEWLLEHVGGCRTPEGRFRLKVLMLNRMKADTASGELLFRGYDDTPFDEAIYGRNHLLRMPGATKLKPVPALVPVRCVPGQRSSCRMIRPLTPFHNIFPITEAGYGDWLDHTICCSSVGVSFRTDYVLTKWKPGPSYPAKRRWFLEFREHRHYPQWIQSFEEVPFDDGNVLLYREQRPTRGRATNQEAERAARTPMTLENDTERELVSPDAFFRDETGERKTLKRFKPGEFLFHVHNGVEENTPSGRVYASGFFLLRVQ